MFEKYLEKIHGQTYSGLDDDMQDDFERWLADLDTDELLEYGDAMMAALGVLVQKYTTPKPEFDGLTLEMLTNKLTY